VTALANMVLRAQAGDLSAFEAIIRQFQDMAVGYAYSILGDFGLAEDAAQEAFLQLYLNLAALRKPEALPAWFRRIVFTQCNRILRHKQVSEVSLEEAEHIPSKEPSPMQTVQKREMQDKVLQTIQALPEKERTVTTLFYINGYSMAEVGGFLDVSVSAVKNRLHSARKKLKERMTDMVDETLKEHAPGEEFSKKSLTKITIELARSQYQEPDILAHFSNPDRNADNPELCHWELSLLKDHGRDGGHILVVGCAGGQESFPFLKAGYQVTGIDIVPEFIQFAREHAKRKGFEDRARFEVVDDFHWPVGDGTCDMVCMMTGFLAYLPARFIRKIVFSECFRVLAPGGVVMMSGPDRTHPATKLERPTWEPKDPEDLEKKSEWGLTDEPGVVVKPGHPCKGDVNAKTIVPEYEADPREFWDEVESCGLRVIRIQMVQEPNDPWPDVALVAAKDADRRELDFSQYS